MRNLKISTIVLAALLVGFVSTNSFAKTWEVDKAHSGFYFTVDHIFSKVHGFFNEYDVDMQFDPADLEASKVVFTIKVPSIDTNIAKRDKHLQSPDFFDAEKYPEMKFTSSKITKEGDNVYNIAGKFEVKGESYDLVLPLVLEGVKDHPMAKGKEVVGFNGGITIDRLKYKVGTGKFADLGIVGKDVDIEVTLELLGDK